MHNQGKADSGLKDDPAVSITSDLGSARCSLRVETDIGMVLHLADGTLRACNTRAEEILGLTAEQIRKWTSVNCPWQAVHEDGSPFLGELHPAMVSLQTGQPCLNIVMGFYQPSGNLVWLNINSHPLFQPNTSIPYAVVTTFSLIAAIEIQSIKAEFEAPHKRTQEFSCKNEERFRIAQLVANAGTWDWDVATNSVYWSPEYYTLYGLDAATPSTYENWLASIVEEDREFVDRTIRQALEQQQTSLTFEFRINHPVQGVRWFDSRSQIFYNPDGQPERLVGISIDITDRKCIEEELRQKNAILSVINESLPTPIFVKDRQGRIIYANPATLEVLGKSEKEVMGLRDCDLYPSRELGAMVTENDRRIMESGQTEVVEESPDGIRTFLGTKAPYRNEAGEVIGLIGISNDITARVQLERDRERILQQEQAAREESERANRIKDEFLAVLSHELRTPLNPILGWSKLLQTGKLNATKTTDALKAIERNAKLQSQLIEDLLDVSRILRGKLTLNVVPVTLAPVINAALETVQLAAEAKSIYIQTIFEPNVGQILGDIGRLQQIIWNLLSNAVKFTKEGGRVEVQLTQIQTSAQIQVIDNGKGISPDFLPHVFEHFRQEDGAITRQFGGLGLGLAIVRQLVELHGGMVTAESAGEGFGATFTVNLPLIKQVTEPVVNFDDPLPYPNDSEPLAGLRIIVVDDEPDSLDFVAFVIEQAGAEVIAIPSAIEALQTLQQIQPHLIISDIGMPEMDGYMFIEQIRTKLPPQHREVLAIALTAFAGEVNERQVMMAGFQKHLAKPVDPDELIFTITRLVTD